MVLGILLWLYDVLNGKPVSLICKFLAEEILILGIVLVALNDVLAAIAVISIGLVEEFVYAPVWPFTVPITPL